MTQSTVYYEKPFLSIDTETTGKDSRTARAVTVSMVVMYPESGRKMVIKEWLINPGVEIPAEASEIHGVTNEIAQANGMEPKVALREVADAITNWSQRKLPAIIYNASYDATLLMYEFARHGIVFEGDFKNVIDPFVLDKHYEKYRKGSRVLKTTSEYYGVPLTNAHESTADAIAAGMVARVMGKKHKIDLDMDELYNLQVEAKKEQALSYQSYLRTKGGQPEAVIPTAWPYRSDESDAIDAQKSPVQEEIALPF